MENLTSSCVTYRSGPPSLQGNGMLLRYRSAVGLPTIMEPDHHTTAFCVNCKSSLCCCPPLCQPESLTSSWSRNRSCSLPSLLTPSGLITSCRTHHGVPTASSEIKVHLNQAALWRKFNAVGTEMILTSAGRRMFPTIDLTVSGLEKDALYSMELEIRRADENRYKYTNSRWIPMGKSDAELPESILPYLHPDSPNTGSSWMKNTTSFKTIKLTNNPNNKHVVLRSMHKYEPRLNITRQSLGGRQSRLVFTRELTECSFIAVTSYQSNQMTQLKIDYNPFAKAFREPAPRASEYLQHSGLQSPGSMPSTWQMSAPYYLHTAGASYPSLYSDAARIGPLHSPSCIASGPSAGIHVPFYPTSLQQTINTTIHPYNPVSNTCTYRPPPIYACPGLQTSMSHPLPVFAPPVDSRPYVQFTPWKAEY